MVTTWLDQNKAFRQALLSAELIFLKRLRDKELFSRTCRLFFFFFFFSDWGLRFSKLLFVYIFWTNFGQGLISSFFYLCDKSCVLVERGEKTVNFLDELLHFNRF